MNAHRQMLRAIGDRVGAKLHCYSFVLFIGLDFVAFMTSSHLPRNVSRKQTPWLLVRKRTVPTELSSVVGEI
jgi:hypothetical protein